MGFASSPIVANIFLAYTLDPVMAAWLCTSFYRWFLDDIFLVTTACDPVHAQARLLTADAGLNF